ncbi:hypothetical protein BI364_06155 [Acidihalobacter yilgarnensis]|uniref:Major facilitator superfamily (MFS) profile domain-containing protein n=1 Tax=Acidihalobacter yilgarnensis TaxID=2819280 RepID=A0A1D8IMA0_9GAMM|nr:MFS transporter [Acidihalobacter yilgarnensis]AOU97596.1 hypothetical protein BI364_06155 [Acidihalobacter yilgarnensis]
MSIVLPETKARGSARRWAVAALAFSLFLAAMDSTVVAVLLPDIGHALGDTTQRAWVMSAYLLAVMLCAPPAGHLADRYGTRPILTYALGLFGIASAGCGLATGMHGLIALRALQGIAGGSIIVLDYTLLGSLFAPHERAKAQGLLSLVWGLAALTGPAIGASVSAAFGWRSVFWINLPLALALMLLLRGVRDNVPAAAPRAPRQPCLSWPSSRKLIAGAVEHRDLLAAFALSFLSSAALYGTVVLLPFYIRFGVETSPYLAAGTITLAAIGWSTGSAVCGHLLNRGGYRRFAALGIVMMISGAALLALEGRHTDTITIWVAMSLLGFGVGFVATASLVLAQNQATGEQLGSRTAAIQFLRNLGAAIGINTLTAVQIGQRARPDGGFHAAFTMLVLTLTPALGLALLLPGRYLEAKPPNGPSR